MLVWALILVVIVKYVLVTMRADNRGEGGSFALLAPIATKILIRGALTLGEMLDLAVHPPETR